MAIRIRQVDAKDPATAALLIHLQHRILPQDKPLKCARNFWWIAYDGELPVAFAAMSRSYNFSDTGYLSRAGVLPSHRGKGLQKRLLRVRQRKAKEMKWNWLITDTYCNPPSSNSLISCGFRLYEPTRPWGHTYALYWRKPLTKSASKHRD